MFFAQTPFWSRTLASSLVFAVLGLGAGIVGGGLGPCSASPLSVCALLAGMLATVVALASLLVWVLSIGLPFLGRLLERRFR